MRGRELTLVSSESRFGMPAWQLLQVYTHNSIEKLKEIYNKARNPKAYSFAGLKMSRIACN